MSAAPTPGSFVNRLLRAQLILPQGEFPGTNSNTLVLENFRMSAKLNGAGNYTNQCALKIWGMRQVDMNAVTVLFGQDGNVQNINARAILILEARTPAGGYLQVFEGQFFDAQPDYKELPEVCLAVNCMSGLGEQYIPVPPSSYQGSAAVAQIAQTLVEAMGFPFENNGVSGVLNTPYFAGTLMDQFRQLCDAAVIDYYFTPGGTLCICPKNQPRQGQAAVVLNRGSGLIGYPTLTRFGIELDALFQPAFELGSPIQVTGVDVPGCNGLWFPFSFAHDLESVRPGGKWQTHLSCARFPASASSSAVSGG